MVNHITEYFEDSSVSQSQLKLLLSGSPRLFNNIREPELYFEEKKHFTIGSAVDCLLTQSNEEFRRQYHVTELENKPTDIMMSIINRVFDSLPPGRYHPITSIEYKQAIIDSIHEHDYRRTWSDDVRYSKVCEHYEYWDELRNSQGKIILSNDEYSIISQIVMSLRTSEYTSEYFQEGNDIEVMYQVPIYWEYDGVRCKALLDMVRIDHKAKTIQPIDIKTLGDYTINFPKSVRQRRYDIQAAFYSEACVTLKNTLNLWEYKILPFKFLVESTIEPGTPLVFTCDYDLYKTGRYGSPEVEVSGVVIRQEIFGFEHLIRLYKYHQSNGFEKDKRVVDNNHHFFINWNGIIN